MGSRCAATSALGFRKVATEGRPRSRPTIQRATLGKGPLTAGKLIRDIVASASDRREPRPVQPPEKGRIVRDRRGRRPLPALRARRRLTPRAPAIEPLDPERTLGIEQSAAPRLGSPEPRGATRAPRPTRVVIGVRASRPHRQTLRTWIFARDGCINLTNHWRQLKERNKGAGSTSASQSGPADGSVKRPDGDLQRFRRSLRPLWIGAIRLRTTAFSRSSSTTGSG